VIPDDGLLGGGQRGCEQRGDENNRDVKDGGSTHGDQFVVALGDMAKEPWRFHATPSSRDEGFISRKCFPTRK
jgi:hypothetical protein